MAALLEKNIVGCTRHSKDTRGKGTQASDDCRGTKKERREHGVRRGKQGGIIIREPVVGRWEVIQHYLGECKLLKHAADTLRKERDAVAGGPYQRQELEWTE